ncbi:MAG TPA: ribonuclease P protein component [Anaerolineales bacterium]|nr:ribonuclease P protein component [Anaerolineales bacterium]
MKRKFRLRKRSDFERVRRHGRSVAHPLIVLIEHANGFSYTRFAVAAGRAVGNAVERNRAKRRLRAILAAIIPDVVPGKDILVIARQPIRLAGYDRLDGAVKLLLEKANLLRKAVE